MEAIVQKIKRLEKISSKHVTLKRTVNRHDSDLDKLAYKIHRECTSSFSYDTTSTEKALLEATEEMLERLK